MNNSRKPKKQNVHSNSEVYEKLLTQKIPADKQDQMKNN